MALRAPPRPWFSREPAIALLVLAALVAITVAVEAYLMQRMYGYFTDSARNFFLHLDGPLEALAYLAEALAYDTVYYATMILLLLPAGAALGLNPPQRNYLVLMFCLSLLGGIVFAKWEIFQYFAARFDLEVLKSLTEGDLSNLLIWIRFDVLVGVLVASGFFLLAAYPLFLLRGRGAGMRPWKPGRRWAFCLVLAWGALAGNHFFLLPHESLREGLSNKTSYWLFNELLIEITDFDNDGFGPLTVPRDPDNLDAGINPYALEVPGDGIDQDGLAGDLAGIDPAAVAEGFPALDPARAKKNVIVVVVETFRTDVAEDPAVMPFLNALGRRHAHTSVYSNFGVTSRAIQSIFFGTLHFRAGSRSLFDEFRSAGYRTYGVSAQSETWGHTASMLQFEKLDRYYDVRDKVWDPKTMTTYQKRKKDLALFLDSGEVNSVAFRMIDDAQGRPFLMYLNYQDLHFPYFHEKMEKVLVDEFHDRNHFFRPGNRAAILRQYRNGALHLDKAFGELFGFLARRAIADDTVVLIVGDHPDSIYENGLSGHAWTLDEHQRRTPLIVVNGRGQWRLPLGQDELARIVVESVNRGDETTPITFGIDPGRRIFELTGVLDRPRQLAWIRPGSLSTYNFRTHRWQSKEGGDWLPINGLAADSADFRDFTALINRWQSERLLKDGASAMPGSGRAR